MKRFILILFVLFGFMSYSNATVISTSHYKAHKIEISKNTEIQKVNFNKTTIVPSNTKAYIGQNALTGVLLIILGALLFIPQLVTIIAATLIILGVVIFVLDIIGMI